MIVATIGALAFLRGHAQADDVGRRDDDQHAGPEQTNRPRAYSGPLAERQAYYATEQNVTAHVQHPVYVSEAGRNAGCSPGVEEELEVPHDATRGSEGSVLEQDVPWQQNVGLQRKFFFEEEPAETVSKIHQGSPTHDDYVAG